MTSARPARYRSTINSPLRAVVISEPARPQVFEDVGVKLLPNRGTDDFVPDGSCKLLGRAGRMAGVIDQCGRKRAKVSGQTRLEPLDQLRIGTMDLCRGRGFASLAKDNRAEAIGTGFRHLKAKNAFERRRVVGEVSSCEHACRQGGAFQAIAD